MIAGAAAPGFSPLLGSILAGLSGWRITFLVVAAFGVVLALHYSSRVGETHPVDRRTPLALSAVASAYGRLAADPRFLLPALAVSLVIGGLYSFFAAAPGVLMNELGLTAFQLGLSFATTVLIVFVAGFLAPRLAHRWGQRTVSMIGLFIALAGGVAMFAFAAAPAFMTFTMAIALYLFGMGLINPLGTAIALHPFGRQAGLASALLGFLQMGCAAIGASLASALPFPPSVSLAVVLTTASVLALLVFLPVFAAPAPGGAHRFYRHPEIDRRLDATDCCHGSRSGHATRRGCRSVLVASAGRSLGHPEASGRCGGRPAGQGWRGGSLREEDPDAGFDPDAVLAPKDQRKVDRFILFALAAAEEALAQANGSLSRNRIACARPRSSRQASAVSRPSPRRCARWTRAASAACRLLRYRPSW